MKIPFSKADILLPENADMSKWAVIACDQYTSEPEYWEDVTKIVGDEPSTLKVTLPEIYLEEDNVAEKITNELIFESLSLKNELGSIQNKE